eukprot:6462957-Amphidinium_carterae.7
MGDLSALDRGRGVRRRRGLLPSAGGGSALDGNALWDASSPSHHRCPAGRDSDLLEVLQTHVYMPESEEADGEVPVALVTVPGSIIWERLTETVPVDATCLFFMEEKSDALPRGYELAALCDYPAEFSSGLVVRLTGDSSGEVLLN